MITIVLTSEYMNANRKHIVVPKGYTLIRYGQIFPGDYVLNYAEKKFVLVAVGDELVRYFVNEYVVARKINEVLAMQKVFNPNLTFENLPDITTDINIKVDINYDRESRVVSYEAKDGSWKTFNWNYLEGE